MFCITWTNWKCDIEQGKITPVASRIETLKGSRNRLVGTTFATPTNQPQCDLLSRGLVITCSDWEDWGQLKKIYFRFMKVRHFIVHQVKCTYNQYLYSVYKWIMNDTYQSLCWSTIALQARSSVLIRCFRGWNTGMINVHKNYIETQWTRILYHDIHVHK